MTGKGIYTPHNYVDVITYPGPKIDISLNNLC